MGQLCVHSCPVLLQAQTHNYVVSRIRTHSLIDQRPFSTRLHFRVVYECVLLIQFTSLVLSAKLYTME